MFEKSYPIKKIYNNMLDINFIIVIMAALYLAFITFENLYNAFNSSLSYSYKVGTNLGNVIL